MPNPVYYKDRNGIYHQDKCDREIIKFLLFSQLTFIVAKSFCTFYYRHDLTKKVCKLPKL